MAASIAGASADAAVTQEISHRLDRSPRSRRIWWLVALLSLGSFCEIYDISLTPYLAPGLVRAGVFKAGTAGMFGLSDAATFVAATFSGLWIGTLACSGASDRWGRLPALRWSLVWYATTSCLMGLQSTAVGVDVLRFLTGLGMGVQVVAIDCFIAEVVPRSIRGRAFAFSTAIQFCAAPIAAAMALVLVPRHLAGVDGWRWLSFAPGVLAAAVLFLQRRVPESPRWLAQTGRVEEAIRVLRSLEQPGQTSAAVARQAVAVTSSSGGSSYNHQGRLTLLAAVNGLQAVGYFGFMNWVPSLLQSKGADLQHSIGYSAAIALSFPLAPLAFALFADRMERKHQLILGMVASAICGVAFAYQTSPLMWMVIGTLVTVASNLVAFALHAYQSEVFSTKTRSRAVGFVYSFSRLSTIFSGYAVTFLLRTKGVVGVFVLLDGCLLCSALAVGIFGPRTRKLALEDIDGA